jgi:prepilin-type N-terminal cleavage/methylation domain-containing protein
MQKNKQSAFTIVELLIVIVVIGILAALVLNTFSGAQAKARDTKRITDIAAIKNALIAYAVEKGDYAKNCGNGSGSGWFSYTYPGYTSTAQCLKDAGYLNEILVDPSGCHAGGSSCSTDKGKYMKYTCGDATYVYGRLEGESPSLFTGSECAASYVRDSLGMNYVVRVD